MEKARSCNISPLLESWPTKFFQRIINTRTIITIAFKILQLFSGQLQSFLCCLPDILYYDIFYVVPLRRSKLKQWPHSSCVRLHLNPFRTIIKISSDEVQNVCRFPKDTVPFPRSSMVPLLLRIPLYFLFHQTVP